VNRSTSMRRHLVSGKAVYEFESHNAALLAWADIRRRSGPLEPILITLDHHTDTRAAFLVATYRESEGLIG